MLKRVSTLVKIVVSRKFSHIHDGDKTKPLLLGMHEVTMYTLRVVSLTLLSHLLSYIYVVKVRMSRIIYLINGHMIEITVY